VKVRTSNTSIPIKLVKNDLDFFTVHEETKQIGKINNVKTRNTKEIPSRPTEKVILLKVSAPHVRLN
jgi:hypothetical protein